jgi:hypothetical protein
VNGGEPEPRPAAFRFEAWPTEHQVVTQPFGANPEAYAAYGLPGHEGVDLRAPDGSKVFCVAPGQVKLVHTGQTGHNYGIHVRVLHAGGYETIYAHLRSTAVEVGQPVEAGQVLGLADSTGNARGAHLHLTLKHRGEIFEGYPGGIIDPTPFLEALRAAREISRAALQLLVAEKLGLNCNAPTDAAGNITPRVADPGLIADTGVGWVRVNFILRPFGTPTNPAWVDSYRRIIRGLRERGLKIYGLIGAEAVAEDPGNQFRDPPTDSIENEWIRKYAQNFRSIVQQFRDDVEVFESFNEPNNWHRVPGDQLWEQAWIDPAWFAVMLQRVYEAVRDLNVTMVSGPLLSTEDGNDAATYLPKVYRAGKERFRWGEPGVPVPFDGVGFHPYVLRDPEDPGQKIPARYREYMEALRSVIRSEEKGRLKPIYLSEIGWQNAEDRQVECMKAGLRCALDDPSVALCFWYGMQDDGVESYGLYRQHGLSPEHRKPVFGPFVELAHDSRRVPAATIRPAPAINDARFERELDLIPDGTVLGPGQGFTKTWRVQNTGTTTWNGGYRLLRVEGHSLGAPASISVSPCAPGQAVDLSVAFVAPPEAMDCRSTWQLVDPQGNPFGDKVWTRIRVEAAAPRGIPLAPAPAGLPVPAVPGPVPPATATALGIIYTTYWLRALAAASATDPQQALLAAANDALAQIREWPG